ncbi:MAG: DUF3347 domain-containing protein [Reichenbachiella sp.]|uniref:DUF3347 domain-containing protein n=1 Tax=Reichenbachiella sp. TaxID=2184521 RepID=UPI00326333EE
MKYFQLLALILILGSCNNLPSAQKQEAETKTDQTKQVSDSTPNEALKFKSKGIQTIYNAYEKLRDALVATDYETAKKFATDLSEALKKDEENMQQASMVEGIISAGEIEAARVAFSALNDSMESIFEGSLESGEINKCYCPMALDNTGASWFSTSKEIKNPYFGDKMLKCGTIKKTIK